MSLYDYNAQEKHWLSPRLVLVYYEDLIKKHGSRAVLTERKYSKAREARSVALHLLGHHQYGNKHYFMQVPKDINESPDIVTMFREEVEGKPVQARIQDVEVVDYEEHETDDITTFLIKKKLSPQLSGKAYDDKTTVLCHIKKRGAMINLNLIHERIKEVAPKPQVLILGNIKDKLYLLSQVWPTVAFTEFDYIKEAKYYPKPDSLKLSLGMGREIVDLHTSLSLPSIDEVFEL